MASERGIMFTFVLIFTVVAVSGLNENRRSLPKKFEEFKRNVTSNFCNFPDRSTYMSSVDLVPHFLLEPCSTYSQRANDEESWDFKQELCSNFFEIAKSVCLLFKMNAPDYLSLPALDKYRLDPQWNVCEVAVSLNQPFFDYITANRVICNRQCVNNEQLSPICRYLVATVYSYYQAQAGQGRNNEPRPQTGGDGESGAGTGGGQQPPTDTGGFRESEGTSGGVNQTSADTSGENPPQTGTGDQQSTDTNGAYQPTVAAEREANEPPTVTNQSAVDTGSPSGTVELNKSPTSIDGFSQPQTGPGGAGRPQTGPGGFGQPQTSPGGLGQPRTGPGGAGQQQIGSGGMNLPQTGAGEGVNQPLASTNRGLGQPSVGGGGGGSQSPAKADDVNKPQVGTDGSIQPPANQQEEEYGTETSATEIKPPTTSSTKQSPPPDELHEEEYDDDDDSKSDNNKFQLEDGHEKDMDSEGIQDRQPTNYVQEQTNFVDPPSGHFMAYFVTAVVLCISGYVIYHNKQKIIAFVLEGRREGQRRRAASGSAKYSKLESSVEEVLPSLEKSTTSKNYVY